MNKKVVIVTGASRGIGACIAEKLAENGYAVIANFNKSEKAAKELKNRLECKNINIDIFKADLSIRDEVKNLIEFTVSKYKKIDCIINNAGIDQIKMFTDITEQDWDYMMNNNLKSVFYMCKETIPYMIKRKCGLILNISSIWGQIGASCESHYAVTKAGIDALTKSLAKELGPSNIRVNSIAPGVIDTEMNSKLDEQIKQEIKNETPIKKIGKTTDIYRCVKWLIEDEFTTGQVISVNGGYVIT